MLWVAVAIATWKAVSAHAAVRVVQLRREPVQQRLHAGDILRGAPQCRERGGGAFEIEPQLVDAGQFVAIDADLLRQLEAGVAHARAHRAAHALAAFDQALGAQVFGHLADDGRADAVLLGKLFARRQPGADGVGAAGDLGAQLLGHLFGEGNGFGPHAQQDIAIQVI